MTAGVDANNGESFNERLVRFKHAEPTDQRRSSRLAIPTHDRLGLTTLRSTPSPLKRRRSPPPKFNKRVKQEDKDQKPTTPRRKSVASTLGTTPSPAPPKRSASKYASPAKYAHLSPIPDVLQPNLLVVFIGVNPGISTARAGHAYSHPSNRFWHLLHVSGLTPERKLSPSEDRDLPRLYGYGHTNIVSRPTKDQMELSKAEMEAGTADLEVKMRKWKPQAVCIAGKGIWEAVWKFRHGKALSKENFKWGWQDESENMGCSREPEVDGRGKPWNGARIFVTTSPSGQAASVPWADKVRIWTEIGEWVKERREEMLLTGEIKVEANDEGF